MLFCALFSGRVNATHDAAGMLTASRQYFYDFPKLLRKVCTMKLSGIAPPARALLHDGIALAADGAAVIRDADSVPVEQS